MDAGLTSIIATNIHMGDTLSSTSMIIQWLGRITIFGYNATQRAL
jgi:hypothetical protein